MNKHGEQINGGITCYEIRVWSSIVSWCESRIYDEEGILKGAITPMVSHLQKISVMAPFLNL